MPRRQLDPASRPPAIQFFCKDWMAKTSGLTHFQESCYLRLLCAARTQSDDWCSLPDDDQFLARVCRTDLRSFRSARAHLVPAHWESCNGRLVHPRLMEEAEIQRQRREQASDAGKKSAASRASEGQRPFNDRSTTVPTSVQRTGNESSTLPLPLGSRGVEPSAFSSPTLAPEPEPNPAEGVKTPTDPAEQRRLIRQITSGVAVGMSHNRTLPVGLSEDELAQKLSGVPEVVAFQVRLLRDSHAKQGVPVRNTIACIDHYLDHPGNATDTRKYYHPKSSGFEFAVQQASIAKVNADHARIRAEERAFANGDHP